MYTLLAAALCLHAPDPSLANGAARVASQVVPEYQWFHRHPEISNQEQDTARHLARGLVALGMEVHEGIGGHGVVGVLRNPRAPEGPVVLYRADMDALPVQENTGLAYASERPGVMHACGHDVHMATALGTLQLLREHPEAWRGSVLFVGQPAEEVGQGARAMLADARFAAVLAQVGRPSVALAWHDSASLPAGSVGLLPGTVTANVDSLDVVLHGKGGHGSAPQETVDATVMGAEFVLQLQTIVSRRLAPGERAVVTVGQFEAGTKRNIIANEALLRLTLRSYEPAVRQRLVQEVRHIAEAVAQSYHAPVAPEVRVANETLEGVYNDPKWVTTLDELFTARLGADHVSHPEARMVGEDFGLFAARLGCPGVLMWLGAVKPEIFEHTPVSELPGLHSNTWAPHAEAALRTGILAMAWAIGAATGGAGAS